MYLHERSTLRTFDVNIFKVISQICVSNSEYTVARSATDISCICKHLVFGSVIYNLTCPQRQRRFLWNYSVVFRMNVVSCVKFYLNWCRFPLIIAKCLGGSLFRGHSVYTRPKCFNLEVTMLLRHCDWLIDWLIDWLTDWPKFYGTVTPLWKRGACGWKSG